ncbi:CDP-alcohol phosphatidyltransferase family protein [Zavarzinella formosa]|uniref:CDP-alcohol phosphatidyltransferase family protein n=1 Tax=Zavarzinella formosa TaxID=360055 RepID=UPI0002FA6FC2|nr:hypothetical protein [Zavarzinella formosa]
MKPPLIRVVFGWMVHFYTACGMLVAAWIAMILMRTELTPEDVRSCFLLMLLATLIDATDGTLAKLVRIKETIPSFDGRRLDDLTDFLTYTCLPLWMIDRFGMLPEGFRWLLLLALLASAYGFCQTNIKTPDGSFVGFPSYWNIVAVYCYLLPITGWHAVLFIGFFSFMTFVPSRYPYPTQPGRLNMVMLALSVPWIGLLLAVFLKTWEKPPSEWSDTDRWNVWVAALYPAFYLLAAWVLSLNRLVFGGSSAR